MVFKKESFKNILRLSISTVCMEFSKLFKASMMMGSSFSFFSASSIVAPMIGVFNGTSRFFTILSIQSLAKWLFLGGSLISLTGYNIPHFFAALYWNTNNRILRVSISVICMLLFAIHPVGAKAFIYAMLWIIPITIAISQTKNIWLIALGSTFTAHAIGSVVWIYSVQMTAASWIALTPVALLERFVFASGMAITYQLYSFVKSNLKSTKAASQQVLVQN